MASLTLGVAGTIGTLRNADLASVPCQKTCFHGFSKSMTFGASLLSRSARLQISSMKEKRLRQPFKVNAAVCYPASITWWKKGNQPNMREINSAQDLVEAIAKAGTENRLVLVEFYSVGCRSCKAMHPKVCQIAADNPDIDVLKVNFHDNLALCRSLGVSVMPFFHFYRGMEGRIDAFSCSLTKINKLRDAVAKHKQAVASPGPVMPLNLNDLMSLQSPSTSFASSS